jgi:hypothetical protein
MMIFSRLRMVESRWTTSRVALPVLSRSSASVMASSVSASTAVKSR